MKEDKSQGFTLVELMIVIVIIAIAVAMLVQFASLVKRQRLTAQINSVIATVALARSEAIKRNQTVTVCSSADGLTCDGVSAADWETGWLVFEDQNADGVVDAGEPAIRMFPALSVDTTTLQYSGASANGNLIYGGNGRLSGPSNNGTFTLIDSSLPTGSGLKTLIISLTGRARLV